MAGRCRARAKRWRRLPGVGRKTANVVLNVAFGEPTIAVDTHIFRVGNRTGLATGKTPFEVETKLEQVVPAQYKLHAHHWLILHGRYTCVARKPLCEKCIISGPVPMAGKNGRIKRSVGRVRMEGSGDSEGRDFIRRDTQRNLFAAPACLQMRRRMGQRPSRA